MMEAAAAGTAAGKIGPKLFDLLAKNHKLRGELEHDLKEIKNELRMISAAIGEDDGGDQDQVHNTWIEMVRQLAHDIDDCIDRFTLQPDASWIRKKLHRAKTVKARDKFAVSRGGHRRPPTRGKGTTCGRRHPAPRQGATAVGVTYDEEPEALVSVGMEAGREELMELIREGQQPKKLKVISLVGFGGIGKTLLARQVYEYYGSIGQYEARAWVRAAEKHAPDVLEGILCQLGGGGGGGAGSSSRSLSNLRRNLRECLGNKRFFIVIDDMRIEFWDDIKEAFPLVPGISSRVIVTTATRSIATKCSGDGHVYVMTTLDEEHSTQLFLKKASLACPPSPGLQVIKKCDGLPLALVTTARVLHGYPTQEQWADLSKNLGQHLETNKNLESMNRVLIRSYTSLGSQDVKTFLLYLGIYPRGRPIRRGSLIRKWLAEGFIKQHPGPIGNALKVAVDNFDKLLDQSIIQPIDVSSSNGNVKTCQTHGMMHEFILRKSMFENFVTLLYDDKDPPPESNIRWLSLQQQSVARAKMRPNDLRLVRSLTVFGEAHKSMLDFSKYELLKVLDLEECTYLMGDQHVKNICSTLVLLRYLSLGAAVTATTLPKKIRKLKLLETLDVRRTGIEILPTQVMKLPCLVHLFGKLKLQESVGGRKMRKLQTWLEENSKLETVAGFVVDKRQKMPQLMDHMKHLTKVKIWCESTTINASSKLSHLSKSIKGFIERGTHLNSALSLSLNINDEWCHYLLNFPLKNDYFYLRSLKLQGNNICSHLPRFVTMLGGVTKLHLSFPDHILSSDILGALSRVHGLQYLKLIAAQLDKLIITHDKLGSLRRLCIVVEVMTELQIEKGALPRLESLQLLCKDLNGFSSTTIQFLPLLKEVTLHDELSDKIKLDWKEAAKNHPTRPNVSFKLMGSEPAAGTSTVAIATDTVSQQVDVEVEPLANYEYPVAPSADTMLSMTMPLSVAPTEESVGTSETGSETVAKIPLGPATTDNMTLSVNHNTFANAQKEYPAQLITSEMGSGHVAEIPVILATAHSATFANHNAFANAQQEYPLQVDGDDHETEDVDNTDDPDYFAGENGQSVNIARFTEEIGVVGLEGQQMQYGTQAEEEEETPEHGYGCLLEAAPGQARPVSEMLEKAKVIPQEGIGKDVVEAK